MHACYRMPDEPTRDVATALAADLLQTDQVEWLPPALWRLHVLGFGNVTRGDAVKVVDVIRDKVGEFAPPTLHVRGVQPLIFDGDDSVWAMLDGDLDDLSAVAKSMSRWVHPLGFAPDRRVYRSAVRLGRVTGETSLDYLEDLVGRVGEHRGPAWDAEAITIGRVRGESLEVFDVVEHEGQLGRRQPLRQPLQKPRRAVPPVPKQSAPQNDDRPRLAVG
jgi:hypothetical protein